MRVSAVNAITTLLEEDKTHAVLRPLLPSLGNLIHDKTEKVRLAVVNMLLYVKKIRGMKYYHVVPAKHLLARLADEGRGRNNATGSVAQSLSELLSNSFFPSGKKNTMSDIITRTLRLLDDNPGAAVTFYRNASTQLTVNSIAKLITALMKCLCYLIMEEKKHHGEDVTNLSQVVDEDESVECNNIHGDVYRESNTAMMATIAESVSILWESVSCHFVLRFSHLQHTLQVYSNNAALIIMTRLRKSSRKPRTKMPTRISWKCSPATSSLISSATLRKNSKRMDPTIAS